MKKFIHVDRCDSTQDLLKEQLHQHQEADLTVSCDHQSLGKGRGENIWEDSEGTLCFSMTVKPHPQSSFTALEISVLVRNFFSLKNRNLYLKWPNDLLNVDKKKCGGILIQTHQSRYLAGIGLNLYYAHDKYGGIFETKFEFDKKIWAQELSEFIRSHRYATVEGLTQDWMSGCYHLHKMVTVIEGNQETLGTFIGLGPYGEALIENDQGIQHIFNGSLRLV